jgi:positive regulator of sigma E activity
MKEDEVIEHSGMVYSISDQYITVQINTASACGSCHAQGLCELSGKEAKSIRVAGKYKVNIGDTVKVVMRQSMGFSAV